MKTNKFGEIIADHEDICDLIMQGRQPWTLQGLTVDPSLEIERMIHVIEDPGQMITWTFPADESQAVPDYDAVRQRDWFMPDHYKHLDIAEHVLELCSTEAQLQRVGQELLMFQERGLFDLLRYLKYLVDVMRDNQVIWGVGRGSSVASYVLYLLGVHRIDSLFYDLDPGEFLR
jgi:DNA polymerase III alpha subunit